MLQGWCYGKIVCKFLDNLWLNAEKMLNIQERIVVYLPFISLSDAMEEETCHPEVQQVCKYLLVGVSYYFSYIILM